MGKRTAKTDPRRGVTLRYRGGARVPWTDGQLEIPLDKDELLPALCWGLVATALLVLVRLLFTGRKG